LRKLFPKNGEKIWRKQENKKTRKQRKMKKKKKKGKEKKRKRDKNRDDIDEFEKRKNFFTSRKREETKKKPRLTLIQ